MYQLLQLELEIIMNYCFLSRVTTRPLECSTDREDTVPNQIKKHKSLSGYNVMKT